MMRHITYSNEVGPDDTSFYPEEPSIHLPPGKVWRIVSVVWQPTNTEHSAGYDGDVWLNQKESVHYGRWMCVWEA